MRATMATSRLSSLRCPTTRPSSSTCRLARMSVGAAIGTPAGRFAEDGRGGTEPFSCRERQSAQTCSIGSKAPWAPSTSSREAEPYRHRDLDTGLGHARRKRWQQGAAHHLLDRRVEIRIARALRDGEVEDAATAIDRKTQHRTTLL